MKTGILVHGVHLQANGWDNIVWGKAPDMMGRIPKAIQMFFRFKPSVMYFGTSASEKDGVKEGQYIFNTLCIRKNELGDFSILKETNDLSGLDIHPTPNGQISYEEDKTEVVIDTVSQNTQEEILAAGEVFLKLGITEVVLVSSASHIPRCIRDAQIVYNNPKYGGKYKVLAQNLIAAPADTCFDGSNYDSTVIFETPHRGGHISYPLNEKAKLLFQVKSENLEKFGNDLDMLISKYA